MSSYTRRDRLALGVMLAALVASLVMLGYGVRSLDVTQSDLDKVVYANCQAIEEINAVAREEAQATIDGDRLLLADHFENGTPLPVPIEAVRADIESKQRKINRLAPKTCTPP